MKSCCIGSVEPSPQNVPTTWTAEEIRLIRSVSFDVALFLNRPHTARPDGEDDGELAANFTLPLPISFLRSAQGGSQKNRRPKEGRVGLASHQIHHPGVPDGVFAHLPRILELIRHDYDKLGKMKTRERGAFGRRSRFGLVWAACFFLWVY